MLPLRVMTCKEVAGLQIQFQAKGRLSLRTQGSLPGLTSLQEKMKNDSSSWLSETHSFVVSTAALLQRKACIVPPTWLGSCGKDPLSSSHPKVDPENGFPEIMC